MAEDKSNNKKKSLTLWGAVSMGTGVMIFVGEKFFLRLHEQDEDDFHYNEP